MNSKMNIGVGGKVQALVLDKNENVEFSTEKFNNTILDQGFQNIIQRNTASTLDANSFAGSMRYCAVGTGTTASAETDTGLEIENARTGNLNDTGLDTDNGTIVTQPATVGDPVNYTLRRTFDFPAGSLDSTVDGDYTEMGVSWTDVVGANLFARTLFKDGTDTPIAITVNSDQILRIVYDLEFLVQPANFSTTTTLFDLGDLGSHNIEFRPGAGRISSTILSKIIASSDPTRSRSQQAFLEGNSNSFSDSEFHIYNLDLTTFDFGEPLSSTPAPQQSVSPVFRIAPIVINNYNFGYNAASKNLEGAITYNIPVNNTGTFNTLVHLPRQFSGFSVSSVFDRVTSMLITFPDGPVTKDDLHEFNFTFNWTISRV